MATNVMLKHGLINVAVKAVKATEDDKDSSFHTICNKGHDPVRAVAPLHCPKCDNRDRSLFLKGQDKGDGTYALVTQDALKDIGATDEEKVELNLTCHPAAEVEQHTLPTGRVYFLDAQAKGNHEHYTLMLELVRRHPEFAFCTVWAVKSKPAMYRLTVFNDALAVTELAWPESVRTAPAVDVPLQEALLTMAEQLLPSMATEHFDPAEYRDKRADMIAAAVAAAEGAVLEGGDEAAPAPTLDLMAAMKAQLDAAAKPKGRKRAPAKARKAS